MLFHQYLLAVWFYIVFSAFAVLGLAFTLRIISNSSLAYAAAKIAGLSVFGYLIWLLGSLRIVNYQNITIIVILLLLCFAAAVFFSRGQFKQLEWKKILWIEAISLILYLSYLYLRSFNPQAYGTEKFMDMALLQANGKTNFFPPMDSWYAGKTVNYYYYGHYLMSLLANLSHSPYALAYNFALALLFGQSLILAFCAAFAVCKSKFFSSLAAFLVVCSGTMFYAFAELHNFFAKLPALSYASSTRLYTPSYIINEIPSYSFTVGDLHAHMMALPFFLLNLILLWAFLREQKIKSLAFPLLPLLVVQLVTSALVNTTDVITLNILFGLVIVYKLYRWHKPVPEAGLSHRQQKRVLREPVPKDKNFWWQLLTAAAVAVILELVLYLPFLLHFKDPTLGIGFAPTYAKAHNLLHGDQYPTPFLALLGMWGVFVLAGLAMLWYKRREFNLDFPFILWTLSLLIIIGVELFFIRDIYSVANPPYFRANTVFKFGYHAWSMLCLAFSAGLAAVWAKLQRGKWLFVCLLAVFIFLGAIYPYQAIKQFFLAQAVTQAKTLDSSVFLQGQSQGDYDMVQYINKNIKTRSVILEAVGDSYSYYARMSVFTGNISPMGWKTHEWTWRFDGSTLKQQEKQNPNGPFETGYGAIATVAADVQAIYESTNVNQTSALLQKYGVQYVYVGNLERSTYANLDEQKFYQLGQLVFSSNGSDLFKIK